ncbi:MULTISPECIES: HAD-IA family hydrolase [unclassified Cryobacterium]|nr:MULTISPECIES: HAD-IA family hydrolase [unclassified Cryobacterium]TFC35856.1 HAD family hydrolase [Cryobacterium sp. TMT2-14]TFC64145.1 HAD family hydrolase [Cryobacterium sp. TMT2-4]
MRGVLFDLDGVLTPTADVHMAAWSRLFTRFLEDQGVSPAYSEADYFQYIDGKPRYDGVRSLLASRGIQLPDGDPTDAPERNTVCGLGNRKNEAFNETLAESGVTPYPGSIEFLDYVVAAGLAVAVVTSSRNGEKTLAAAGIRGRFEIVVDGLLSAERGLAGKPAPDTYELGAALLGLDAVQCVVVEDAHSGIQAGRAGNFGLVLGVDRGVGTQTLLDAGADVVVTDLHELLPNVETEAGE